MAFHASWLTSADQVAASPATASTGKRKGVSVLQRCRCCCGCDQSSALVGPCVFALPPVSRPGAAGNLDRLDRSPIDCTPASPRSDDQSGHQALLWYDLGHRNSRASREPNHPKTPVTSSYASSVGRQPETETCSTWSRFLVKEGQSAGRPPRMVMGRCGRLRESGSVQGPPPAG
jgi:hypothetical protein